MFKENAKVITSKGRFARIVSSNEFKSIILIGKKTVEVCNDELLELSDTKAVIVEYYPSRFDSEIKSEMVHINNKIPLFDFSKPVYDFTQSEFFKECADKLNKRINNTEFIIFKIKVV